MLCLDIDCATFFVNMPTYTDDIVMKPGPTVRRTTLVENFSAQASLRKKNVVVMQTEKY